MSNLVINQGDTEPALSIQLLNPDGTPRDLTGSTVKLLYRLEGAATWTTKNATVEEVSSGMVRYQWVEGDTDTPGDYYYVAEVTTGEDVETFPNDTYYEFTILPQLDGADSITPYAKFYGPLRALLGDNDLDIHIYEDDTLRETMMLVLNLGKVTGFEATREGISPALVAKANPTAFAQLLWNTGRIISAAITASSFTTRAFSERIGEPKELINLIVDSAYLLDSGVMSE